MLSIEKGGRLSTPAHPAPPAYVGKADVANTNNQGRYQHIHVVYKRYNFPSSQTQPTRCNETLI